MTRQTFAQAIAHACANVEEKIDPSPCVPVYEDTIVDHFEDYVGQPTIEYYDPVLRGWSAWVWCARGCCFRWPSP